MKKRILIIENSLYLTGGLSAILSTTERLKDQFDFFYVIPAKSQVGPLIESKGYAVCRLPFLEISKNLSVIRYLPVLFKNARRLLTIMKKHDINILHVNDVFNLVGCAAKRLNPGIFLVNHVRLLKNSYIAPLYPFFCKQIKKYADRIICVSEAVRRDVGDTPKSTVIYDVPLITEKYPLPERQKEGLRILYLGNYLPGKGQAYGLAAFKELKKFYPDANIKFVGASETPESTAFKKQLMEQAADNANIEFAGKTSDVEWEMKQHDLVLNLSVSESFSFVCLEAMLYGVPLITANSGGPAEITDHGNKAMLIPVKDASAAAEALKLFASDPAGYRQKAVESKIWAKEKFDPEQMTNRFTRIYSLK